MDNVINFPTEFVRDWASIEREMMHQLTIAGASPQIKERLSERMKAFYELIQTDFNFSVETPHSDIPADKLNAICTAVSEHISASLAKRLHAYTHALFVERFDRELEACREIGLV